MIGIVHYGGDDIVSDGYSLPISHAFEIGRFQETHGLPAVGGESIRGHIFCPPPVRRLCIERGISVACSRGPLSLGDSRRLRQQSLVDVRGIIKAKYIRTYMCKWLTFFHT